MAKTKQSKIVKVPFWQDDRKVAWLFFGIAFLLYVQTIWFDFTLDDRAVTFDNKFVKAGFGGLGDILKTFYWAGFWDSNAGLFRPLSLILFAIEWQFAPNHPHVFHFVNVVLYATCAYLLYRTLRELFRHYSLTLPFLATLLWIVFPAHTEVVANIKSGDELLSMIFFLMMLRQLMKWSENNLLKPLLLSGIYFFLSLLSKEGAVLFLPIVFIILYLFKKKEVKQFVKPALVLAGFTMIWFVWHSAVIANAPKEKITYSYHDNSLVAAHDISSRVATAMEMQGKYLLKSFIGFPLSYDYSFNENPIANLTDLVVIVSILICLGLFAFAVFKFRKEPVLSFGILFYFITFTLTSNVFILIGATMADRFLFAPSLGFVIALSWFIIKVTKGEKVKLFHFTAMYILLPLSLLYAIRSFTRSSDWENETKLFTADVENSQGSARVHYNYGVVVMGQALATTDKTQKAQLNDQAYNEFTTAFKIDSVDIQTCFNLGVIEYRRGNFTESEKWSREVLKINPQEKSVLGNLADAIFMEKRYVAAIEAYKNAIANNIITDDTWNLFGLSYVALGDTAKGIEALENSVKHDPNSIKNWDKLANICGMNRKYQRSSEAFLEIAKLDPSNPQPYSMVYFNYLRMGDTATAMKYKQEYINHGGK